MILVEMVHDARIIPIYASAEQARAAHKPAVIKPWLGDTVAWWEGDTLVAETRNVHPVQASRTSDAALAARHGDRTLHAHRRRRTALPVPRRGSGPLHAGVVGRVCFKPGKGVSTNTPATKAITRWTASSAARVSRKHRRLRRQPASADRTGSPGEELPSAFHRRRKSNSLRRIWSAGSDVDVPNKTDRVLAHPRFSTALSFVGDRPP